MKTIGNIFGTVLILIGVWRFFTAFDGATALSNGLYLYDYTGAVQRTVHSLFMQGVIFLIIGIVVLLLANLIRKSK